MKLYEIDKAIMDLVDLDTGEITDYEALDALQMARTEKLENVALAIKTLTAEADALKNIENDYKERRQAKENRADGLKEWLKEALNGEGMETDRVRLSLRKSPAKLEYDKAQESELLTMLSVTHEECLNRTITLSKSAVISLLKQGEEIPGFSLVNGMSLIIK